MDLLMCYTVLLPGELWSLVFLVVTIIHSMSVSCHYEAPKTCLETKTLELHVPFLFLLWSLLVLLLCSLLLMLLLLLFCIQQSQQCETRTPVSTKYTNLWRLAYCHQGLWGYTYCRQLERLWTRHKAQTVKRNTNFNGTIQYCSIKISVLLKRLCVWILFQNASIQSCYIHKLPAVWVVQVASRSGR